MPDIYRKLGPPDADAGKLLDEHMDATAKAVKKMRVFTLSKDDGPKKADEEEEVFEAAPHAASGDENMKLGLTAALINADDWTSASEMCAPPPRPPLGSPPAHPTQRLTPSWA